MRALSKITLAIGILCIFALAQTTPKAAVYIMGNPEGRDALRMAVNNFLIKSGKYQMIAVDAIDVVAKEQNRQKSGSVTDSDIALLGRDAGAEYVCVVERTELDGISYVATRMVSVQSKVAELADMTELPRGGKIIDMIQWQIGSMLGMSVGPRPKTDASEQANYAQPVYAAQTQQAVPAIQGTLVPGATLAEKLAWLQRSADSHNTYVLEVSADENIAPHTFEYKGAINITIVLRGVGGNRVIRLKSHGNMFRVHSNVTLILDNNITLMGHNGNTGNMVTVDGGMLKMNAGVTIAGNTTYGGVYVSSSGTFEMTGGTISGNGKNTDTYGGVDNRGTFTMSGGIIIGNTSKYGGGVYNDRTFTMSGGTISGNNAYYGGGVYNNNATFTMKGGIITGNTAQEKGGGVYASHGRFNKTSGTITGYNSDQSSGNVVNDGSGAMARKGHAVYYNENKRKETTAGPGVKLCTDNSCTGGWDE
jgi:hypothetical protein